MRSLICGLLLIEQIEQMGTVQRERDRGSLVVSFFIGHVPGPLMAISPILNHPSANANYEASFKVGKKYADAANLADTVICRKQMPW